MGQLQLRAIDPQLDIGLAAALLASMYFARWELTCGFCRTRFRKTQIFTFTWADCPNCGTRNLLPTPLSPPDSRPRRPR
jgi:hypothetical protein